MTRIYGSLDNRFEENKNFNKDCLIHIGDDITMYHYSDRTCYYVTDVIDQKHIKVREYHVCADHSKPDLGPGHNEWKYFKSRNEENEYLKSFGLGNDETYPEEVDKEWVFRYNNWKECYTYTKDSLKSKNMFGFYLKDVFFTEKEVEKLEADKVVKKYYDLPGKISFGVRDYFYDWTF